MQSNPNPISQSNISASVAAEIRRLIIDGTLKDGERLNEVHLALQLGVSRTPLREALNRLEAEGALESKPRIGFAVKPLTAEEFTQLYGVRPILDPAALRLAGVPSPTKLKLLQKLNRDLERERDAETAVSLDDAWHLELLEGCPNRILVGFIENVMQRTRRYELALMRETEALSQASRSHQAILKALSEGDLEQACRHLEANMTNGYAPVLKWLKLRVSNNA